MRQLRSLLLHAKDVPEGNCRTVFQSKHPGIFIDLFYIASCSFVRASRFAIIRLEKNNGNNMTGVSFDAALQIMELLAYDLFLLVRQFAFFLREAGSFCYGGTVSAMAASYPVRAAKGENWAARSIRGICG